MSKGIDLKTLSRVLGDGFGKYERVETEIKGPRPKGFYWVKYSDQWTIGEWHGDHWSCLNDSVSLKDYNFEIIYETPIEKPNI